MITALKAPAPTAPSNNETTETTEVSQLVSKAVSALEQFSHFTQEQVDHIVEAAALAARDQHATLARLAVEETKRGNFEDKTVKNIFASEYIAADMRGLRTVGVISTDEFSGITQVAEPVGVIAALTPVTNPTSTTIFKALMCLKTRNPVIFAFHPHAQRCSIAAATTVLEAAKEAGAPPNCIQWIAKPAMTSTEELLNSQGVDVILATGGNAMVQAAYSCGKPALGVGAGNVPAYIHSSADVERAVYDVVSSKAFDNGMICASEQAVILDESIAEQAYGIFGKFGAYRCSAKEITSLEKLIFGCPAGPEAKTKAKLNPAVVGLSATEIAKQAGFCVPDNTQVLLADIDSVGPHQPLSREKLCPVLAVLRAANTDAGIDLAVQMVELDGRGHTAVVHAFDQKVVEDFGHAVSVVRVVANSPASHGAIGGIYNALLPSLTLGCGSYGRNSVSNNVTAVNLINIKRIARRNDMIRPFQIPPQVFHGVGAVRQLAVYPGITRATIVTDKHTLHTGVLDTVLQLLHNREAPVSIQIIDDIERTPELEVLSRAAADAKGFAPDTFIAVGPTAVINATKLVRAALESPGTDFESLFKGRGVLPGQATRTRLVCLPTISGGQAALSAKAAAIDPQTGLERLLEAGEFLSTAVMLDPQLAREWSTQTMAERGFETISQATEAYLSIHASDLTDALSMHALEMSFVHLPKAVAAMKTEEISGVALKHRDTMVSAGALTAAALGNTSLGLANAMSQAYAEFFDEPRQRPMPALLPNVVRFNGKQPTKLVNYPGYDTYVVPKRCEEIARHLCLEVGTGTAAEAYAKALETLREQLQLPASLKALGTTKAQFKANLDALALRAFDYQSHGGNPRTALLEEIKTLYTICFEGGSVGP
ncbi:MAG: iron-containing alcohol dehydrogenase [Actinomycetaceae bacterium]|nr:iron-containing alcohol dehydrogenase [Actinomycetaceae bacterium]